MESQVDTKQVSNELSALVARHNLRHVTVLVGSNSDIYIAHSPGLASFMDRFLPQAQVQEFFRALPPSQCVSPGAIVGVGKESKEEQTAGPDLRSALTCVPTVSAAVSATVSATVCATVSAAVSATASTASSPTIPANVPDTVPVAGPATVPVAVPTTVPATAPAISPAAASPPLPFSEVRLAMALKANLAQDSSPTTARPAKRLRSEDPYETDSDDDYHVIQGDERRLAVLDLRSTAQVRRHLRRCLFALQQLSCKVVAKAWIRAIEPKKQTRFPYNRGAKSKPKWWPETVRHKEPDHLKKPERIVLLMSLITSRLITVDRLKAATNECMSAIQQEKIPLLEEIYYVVEMEQLCLDGMLIQPWIYVSGFEGHRRIFPKTLRRSSDCATDNDQQSSRVQTTNPKTLSVLQPMSLPTNDLKKEPMEPLQSFQPLQPLQPSLINSMSYGYQDRVPKQYQYYDHGNMNHGNMNQGNMNQGQVQLHTMDHSPQFQGPTMTPMRTPFFSRAPPTSGLFRSFLVPLSGQRPKTTDQQFATPSRHLEPLEISPSLRPIMN